LHKIAQEIIYRSVIKLSCSINMCLLLLSPYLLKAQGRYGSELPEDAITCLTSIKGYLYSGIDNYLRVNFTRIPDCDTLFLSTSKGTILSDTLDRYLIIPERPGNIRLTIQCLKNTDTLTLGYRYYMVQNLPDPCIILNKQPVCTPASVNKNIFLITDSISVFFSDDIIGSDSWLKITDFTIGYNYGGFLVSHLNATNKISQKTREIIYLLGPDHEVSIRFNVESEGKISKQLPIYRLRLY
jgi:hypothetical protein